nr:hypothetical protein [uncultured bacterium]
MEEMKMSNQYVVSDGDAVNLQYLVAMCTDEYDTHIVLFDNGTRMGVTDELFKKIMAAIHNQGR